MKTFLHTTTIFLNLLLASCSNNYLENPDYEYAPPLSNPCQDDEEYYLNQLGSLDAPILGIRIGIESGTVSIHWSDLKDAEYYELEECYCPSFAGKIYVYIIYDYDYLPEINFPTYFRVRAFINGTPTGWSNVVKNSYGIMH
jgi:hypothetical protein